MDARSTVSGGVFDPDPELDDLETQSGLGKGLSSIISELAEVDPDGEPRARGGRAALLGERPEEASVPPSGAPATAEPTRRDPNQPDRRAPSGPPGPGVRRLRDELVKALLDGLANTMRPDLCAYLHHAPPESDRFFCLRPPLDELGPQRVHDVIATMKDQVAAGRDDRVFAAAEMEGTAVLTRGRGAVGLYVVAREEGMAASEVEVASRFCRSFGRAVHQLDGGESTPTVSRLVRVDVHPARDSVLAEVEIHTGDAIRPGQGRAATRVEAITRAVIVASGQSVTFRYASEAAHGGEHAAVVLLEGAAASVSLGSARSQGGPGSATAEAALRALEGLS